MNKGVTFLGDNDGSDVNQSIDEFLSHSEKVENPPPIKDTAPTQYTKEPTLKLSDEQIQKYLENVIGGSSGSSGSSGGRGDRHYYEDSCHEGSYHLSKCNKCRHRMCGSDYSFNSNAILYFIIIALFIMIIILLCKK